MKSEYVTLLTITISLLSGWGGALIAGYFSRKASTDALDKENKLEIEKRKEIERKELLNLYVDIIKTSYERSPITYGLNGEADFDFPFFNDEIRPKIYEKYYLIHEKVIIYFNQIEEKNAEIEHNYSFGEFNVSDITEIAHSYQNMVNEIKLIVNKQRAIIE